jgi:hypothetical protein
MVDAPKYPPTSCLKAPRRGLTKSALRHEVHAKHATSTIEDLALCAIATASIFVVDLARFRSITDKTA